MPLIDVRAIATTTHGRYLVARPDNPDSRPPHPVLVGFHGYKENAAAHLEQLRSIAGQRDWLLVSVQGLSRFYSKQEEIVASWMTREDRELAIADNIAYVSGVISDVQRHYSTRSPLVYAGFSQGVAMAYRVAAFAGHPCHGLIVLAGDVPPDVQPVASGLPAVLLGRGTGDPWYSKEKAQRDVDTLQSAGVAVSEHLFAGGHEWEDSFRARAAAFLDEVKC
jgi:predicted esterase